MEESEEEGGGEEEGVDAVEEAAVAWDGGAHVFDADVAFDEGDGEVAELCADADDQAGYQLVREGEGWREGKGEEEGEGEADGECAQCAFPGFVGADVAAQGVAAGAAEEVSSGARSFRMASSSR